MDCGGEVNREGLAKVGNYPQNVSRWTTPPYGWNTRATVAPERGRDRITVE